jgi:hypothetical protein
VILAIDPLYVDGVGLAVPRWGLRPQTPSAPGSLALARSLGSEGVAS